VTKQYKNILIILHNSFIKKKEKRKILIKIIVSFSILLETNHYIVIIIKGFIFLYIKKKSKIK